MDAGPRISSYAWSGGREPMLRFGPEDGPTIVLALPLFEEANRTRAFGIGILRALAARGIGGTLPELPGQGESETPTDRLRLNDLRAAFAAVPGSHAVAIRSGALVLDDRPRWLLAPQTGPELLRELARVNGAPLQGPVEVAGNLLSKDLLADFHRHSSQGGGPHSTVSQGSSGPGSREARTVRLASDSQTADLKFDQPPLWRRAEPDNNHAFAQQLAADIARWLATCVA